MSGLPRKYAKMGFKRGWAAYKSSKRGGRRMHGIVDYPLMGRSRKPKHSGSSKSARKPYRGYWKQRRPYDASQWMTKHHKLHGAGGVVAAATTTLKDGLFLAGGVILGRAVTALIMNKVKQIPAPFAPVIPIGLGVFAAMQRNRIVRMVGLGSATGAIVKLGDRYVTPMLPAALQGDGEITASDVEQALLGGEIRPDEAALLVDEYGLNATPALLGAIEQFAGEVEDSPEVSGEDADMYGEEDGAGY